MTWDFDCGGDRTMTEDAGHVFASAYPEGRVRVSLYVGEEEIREWTFTSPTGSQAEAIAEAEKVLRRGELRSLNF